MQGYIRIGKIRMTIRMKLIIGILPIPIMYPYIETSHFLCDHLFMIHDMPYFSVMIIE